MNQSSSSSQPLANYFFARGYRSLDRARCRFWEAVKQGSDGMSRWFRTATGRFKEGVGQIYKPNEDLVDPANRPPGKSLSLHTPSQQEPYPFRTATARPLQDGYSSIDGRRGQSLRQARQDWAYLAPRLTRD